MMSQAAGEDAQSSPSVWIGTLGQVSAGTGLLVGELRDKEHQVSPPSGDSQAHLKQPVRDPATEP